MGYKTDTLESNRNLESGIWIQNRDLDRDPDPDPNYYFFQFWLADSPFSSGFCGPLDGVQTFRICSILYCFWYFYLFIVFCIIFFNCLILYSPFLVLVFKK